jgi:hypothetical protein
MRVLIYYTDTMSEISDDFEWPREDPRSRSLSQAANLPREVSKAIPPRPLGDGTWKHYGLGSCTNPYRDGPDADAMTVNVSFPTEPAEIIASSEREAAADEVWIKEYIQGLSETSELMLLGGEQ